MLLFRAIVFSAVLAGLLAGAAVSVLQHFGTIPLILQAESHESAGGGHAHGHGDAAPARPAGWTHPHANGTAHVHAADAWAPADGFERHAFTLLSNILSAIAFALLLTGAYALRGAAVGWHAGLFWGLAGFGAFMLAPSLGVPPELPGMPAAPLEARQLWWFATAFATAGGIALLAFGRTPWAAVAAVLLIILPHVVGAPHPAEPNTAVPESLVRAFGSAAILTGFVLWMLLGGLTGLFYARFAR